MHINIDHPTQSDRPDWERLYQGYAEFYQVPMDQQILSTVWSWISDPDHSFYCLLAKDESGRGIGLMHYRAMVSPLRGVVMGFLDDFFVEVEARGGDVGKQLFAALQADGRKYGWPKFRWITADDNYRARGLYDQLSTRTHWILYEMALEN